MGHYLGTTSAAVLSLLQAENVCEFWQKLPPYLKFVTTLPCFAVQTSQHAL